MKSKLGTLRTIISELRHAHLDNNVKNSPAFQYIMEQYRKNAVTDAQYCRKTEQQASLADTYATYLSSRRLYQELYNSYYSRKEKTVSEAAKTVGLKLPNDH